MSSSTPLSAAHDPGRLSELAQYGILDTPAEPSYDGIVHLASRLCEAPVALISLVAGDRQWFKARLGFPHCETELSSSICAHALAQPDALLVIQDLIADPRTADNPLVKGEPFIRFYAGAPLRTSSGLALGSLCVIDKVPRPDGLTEAQATDLRVLAEQVMSQLELRRALNNRDAARAAQAQEFRAREALRDTQAAVAKAAGDLAATLYAVVDGAMRAVPAAEGGAIELLVGDELECRSVRGTLEGHQGLRLPLTDSGAGRSAITRKPYLMTDARSDPHLRHDLSGTLQLGSAVFAPILRGEMVYGVLKLHSRQPIAFDRRDLDLISLFAGAATAGLTEAASRAAARAKDLYWRELFEHLSEGFQLSEVIRNRAGQITDYRLIEVNTAWSKQIGMPADLAVGRTARELFGDSLEEWIRAFAQVFDTGESWLFTRHFTPNDRWYDGSAFKVDGDRFGVMFLDVTARVNAEIRRAALLDLGDRLRDLTTVPDMTRAAAEIVCQTLGARRACYGRIVGDVEEIVFEVDLTAPDFARTDRRQIFAENDDIRAHIRRGEAVVINDVCVDPRTRHDPHPMLDIGIGSLVIMPVRDRGRTVAVFIAQDERARIWISEELEFLRDVADRVEVGTSRVRAEGLQAVLNKELAHRLKNTLTIVQSLAKQTLRGITENHLVDVFEHRVLTLSRAHDLLMQKNWTEAKMRAVMEGVLTMQADIDRFTLTGPDFDINPQATLSLSMLMHEMVTNALKYGALCNDTGRICIGWRTENEQISTFVLDWAESGGPAVTPPRNRGGFGSRLIRMGLMGTRAVTFEYDPTGLRVEFRAPLAEFAVVAPNSPPISTCG